MYFAYFEFIHDEFSILKYGKYSVMSVLEFKMGFEVIQGYYERDLFLILLFEIYRNIMMRKKQWNKNFNIYQAWLKLELE